MNPGRDYEPLDQRDLEQLRDVALKEHTDFFNRNRHLAGAYEDRLIGICLCQGAASHYLTPSVGIKDLDVWHFYVEDNRVPFPYRAHKSIPGGHRGRNIDFLKRAVPPHLVRASRPDETIMAYLHQRDTTTKDVLLKKGIVGLYPDSIFTKIIWRGTL